MYSGFPLKIDGSLGDQGLAWKTGFGGAQVTVLSIGQREQGCHRGCQAEWMNGFFWLSNRRALGPLESLHPGFSFPVLLRISRIMFNVSSARQRAFYLCTHVPWSSGILQRKQEESCLHEKIGISKTGIWFPAFFSKGGERQEANWTLPALP